MLKAGKKSEGLKAHRFTKYAAAYYKPENDTSSSRLLLYYVDESNYLQESVGRHDQTNNKWNWKSAAVVSTVPPKSFLAVTQRREKTYLVYRDEALNLCLLVGSKRAKLETATWSEPISTYSYRARFFPCLLTLTNTWPGLSVILKAGELLKDSPLAIVGRCNGNTVTIFYVQRNGQQKSIFSIDRIPGSKLQFHPKRVGKLEPDSILGAASFPANPLYDARQFSVSNLDGDNILVERIPKYYAKMLGGQQWVLSGGVVDTDVDELKAQIRIEEESDSE